MDIRPIRNQDDYKAAQKEVSKFFDNQPKRGTLQGDRFEVLLTLMNSFENEHHAIVPPDPIEAIKFRMEQQGLSIQDMVPLIGATNRVYEVLNQTRPLTLSMMKRLRTGLKIPGDVLLGPEMAETKRADKPSAKPRKRQHPQAPSSR
ncbi:MAG TPA: transcriptional regulator [Burkholderiaceae bacterium]|jgi:HTH-type transcriptional regulator/antitoxin HigA